MNSGCRSGMWPCRRFAAERIEVDVATLREPPAVYAGGASSPGTQWSPSQPAWVGEIDGPDRDWFEVRIVEAAGGPRLVAAIELVSPANKDRPAHRQAFAGKCAGYLRQSIGLIVVDVVTDRHESLQRAIQDMLELDAVETLDSRLFAAAYRTVPQEETLRLEIWYGSVNARTTLPTLPFWLEADLAVPVDLEATTPSPAGGSVFGRSTSDLSPPPFFLPAFRLSFFSAVAGRVGIFFSVTPSSLVASLPAGNVTLPWQKTAEIKVASALGTR